MKFLNKSFHQYKVYDYFEYIFIWFSFKCEFCYFNYPYDSIRDFATYGKIWVDSLAGIDNMKQEQFDLIENYRQFNEYRSKQLETVDFVEAEHPQTDKKLRRFV